MGGWKDGNEKERKRGKSAGGRGLSSSSATVVICPA